jgi:hypothetical protein
VRGGFQRASVMITASRFQNNKNRFCSTN